MKKQLVGVIAVAALVGAAGVWWWLHRHAAAQDALTLQGNVDIRQISLAFDGAGRVDTLLVEEGDKVRAGQLLATLDTRALQLQAAQAQAQIEVQTQALNRLRNGARPQELAQAKARAAAAQAQLTRAEQDLARLQDIAGNTQGRGVSTQDLAHARTQVEVARAQAADQQEALRLTQIGAREEDLASGEAQLKAAQAQSALLAFQVYQGQLRAPADAVVRSRLLEPGDMTTASRAVYALALTHPKWIRVYVGETELGRIRTGMPAPITTDSQPDAPVQGRVGFISSVAEFTPKTVQTEELRTSLVYEVRVVAEDEHDQLRLGQPATVRLGQGDAK
ncbi:biotin/lipoyl-binding protein [Stenotrophomonas sp. Sm10]|uniref:HlyD family efflux transporter periplasmic adaptor subunit n=1 Tax=Stenotrophomonas sp. Sm10 TaxID=3002754 RepID=UPI0027E50CCA|nr:biotin/lipoyl-binding protein [Stenotrophomonas sp. Sm10]MDQ7310550.1 biotin/lipoyl-binding protein [Stenotrophomonas sp. Sm10]